MKRLSAVRVVEYAQLSHQNSMMHLEEIMERSLEDTYLFFKLQNCMYWQLITVDAFLQSRAV